jgi:hypothetical protein
VAKKRRGLGVASGEHYALLPREVLESAAYHAAPDWSRSVLIALAVQYTGTRNGSLALPVAEASALGVRQTWQLYAGLSLLDKCSLISCTRRGRLEQGKKLASLFALTWRGIDEPRDGVTYDAGTRVCPVPSHAWAKWTRPADWDATVRVIVDRARGSGSRKRARDRLVKLSQQTEIPDTTAVGSGRPHTGGTGNVQIVPTPGVKETRITVPTPGVSSEISGRGAACRPCRLAPLADIA